MRKISISAFIIAVLLTGSLYLVNQRVNDLANKVASLIKVGASQSISSLTELTSLSHNDVLPITEVNGLTTKKVKWGTATSSMKAVFDPLYSPIFSTSAGLAGLLSDETGSSGGFVRAGSPTLTSPMMTSPVITLGSDANGDMYYRNTGVFSRLGVGTAGQLLTASSTGFPEWRDFSASFNTITVTGTSTFATTTHNAVALGKYHFGGSGSDGALNVTSGETVINLGGGAYVEKNYTSISITGTGKVSFSNASPNGSVIVLKSQGSCTFTSSMAPMLTATGTGSIAGYSVTAGNNSSVSGISASTTYGTIYGYNGGTGGVAGSNATNPQNTPSFAQNGYLKRDGSILKYPYVIPGAGGGSGGGTDNTGGGGVVTGAGGRGAGVLIVECAGAWNFTTASGISVQGINGSDGAYSGSNGCAGGGGGGGGGEFLGLYNYLIANTGTVTSTGGSAGARVNNASSINGASGAVGGNSVYGLGGSGSAGGNPFCGNAGAGANGTSTIMQNTQME